MNLKLQLRILMFQIGVDCLGFPQYHKHELVYGELPQRRHITIYHEKYHNSKKL
ncbi:hypothetical protein J2X97_000316 [Epilithonimonas hungarica]|nr:hypothetical protein [Epilithonimonas hungarica]